MILSKVSVNNGHTYIVVRASYTDGEYTTITVPGEVEVSMNRSGTALSIKPREV